MVTYLSGNRIQGILGTVIPATTGWAFPSSPAAAITSGTGMVVTGTTENITYYDLGTTVPCTNNMVIDYDLTRTSGDYYDHPMLHLRNTATTHGDVGTNGDSKLMLLYWANGNTGSGNAGGAVSSAQFKESGTVTELSLGNSTSGYRQPADGTTRYYRFYISKAGDTTRDIRWSVWTTDAYRTAEGSTGREFDEVQGTALGSGWLTSNDLRYLIVDNQNGQVANWILSNLKIWSNVQSTGVANNLLDDTPTHTFNFTDVPATDEKVAITNIPIGTRFEETDTRKIFRRKDEGYTVGQGSASDGTTSGAASNAYTAINGVGSLDFDGSNDYVSLSQSFSDTLDTTSVQSGMSSAWTVSLWAYVETASAQNTYLSKIKYGYTDHEFNLRQSDTIFQFGGSGIGTGYTGTAVSHTGWRNVIVSVTGIGTSTITSTMYIDNDSGASLSTTSSPIWNDAGDTLMYVGQQGNLSSERPMSGQIQDVCFWNKELSSANRTVLFGGGDPYAYGTTTSSTNTGAKANTVEKANIVAYYTFDGGSVTNSAKPPSWVEKGTA